MKVFLWKNYHQLPIKQLPITKIHLIMLKQTGLSVFALIFIATLFTSCSKHEICPAYTLDYKKEKINTIKNSITVNQQFTSDNY